MDAHENPTTDHYLLEPTFEDTKVTPRGEESEWSFYATLVDEDDNAPPPRSGYGTLEYSTRSNDRKGPLRESVYEIPILTYEKRRHRKSPRPAEIRHSGSAPDAAEGPLGTSVTIVVNVNEILKVDAHNRDPEARTLNCPMPIP